MLLKKLEMYGFKSFADKTEFDFRSGITAFVGPNGCGKSNLVDAVRWILGEQSARAVRAPQMTEVIFSGSATRGSLGYAEASLSFLNDRGALPSEYAEVCVTRRLYRSGESEYFLNRQPCRLRDIRQLFMDTGIGVDTYSIIEQGKVERFIQSNAKERRVIFEEAAGISRYKSQRREAQARLERTRINLQKVDVKLEEQRKQLRSIKYQAAKAKRHRESSARLREIVLSISVKNYLEWEAKRKGIEGEIGALAARESALAADLAQMELLIQGIVEEISNLEAAHLQKRDALHEARSATEAAERTVAHNTERIREFQAETDRSTRELWSLTEKLRQTREQADSAARDLESIRQSILRQAEIIAAESQKADSAGQERERLAAAIEEWKGRMLQIIEKATTLRNELNHMDSSRRQELARRARLQGQQAEKAGEAARLEEGVRQLVGRRDELSERLAERSAVLHEREGDAERLGKEAESAGSRLRAERHHETQLLARRESLQDLELRAEDVEAGVKQLLREDDERVGFSVRGMVADLVRAELPYASAIESALGDAAQYVVTLDEREAGSAVALLRADRSGRAGLIPIVRARAAERSDAHLTAEPGVLGRASDLVRYSPEMEPVVRHLLGATWVVDNLATALRLSSNGAAEMRFVTLEGERVEPSGAIFGGEPLPRSGIVSRKSELEAIRAELSRAAEGIARLEAESGRIAQRIESVRSEAAALRKEIEEGNLEKLSNENEILNLRRRQKALTDESAVLAREIAEIDEVVRGYTEREKAIEQELAAAVSQRDQLQQEMESARRTLADQQAAADRMRNEVERLKVELAQKEARRGGLEESIAAAGSRIAELDRQIAAARQRIEEFRSKQAQAEREIADAQAKLAELIERKRGLDGEIGALQEAQSAARARRSEQTERHRTLRADRETLREQLQQGRLEEQELRVRIEGLSERVFNEQGVRLVEAAAQFTPPADCDWNALQAEIGELREKIRRMGGVNEESIDEEAGLEIEIAQTDAQRADLVKAAEDLQEVIRKLNRVSREKFQKTFEEVRQNFQESFRRLFGGGRCDLALQQDELDVLEAGIEVLACPPGKELRSITLLSGGEKTMTTIALLFAIFRAKPSPFCILDEVDASLDESNIDRFTAMLGEYVQNSQFIIITHNKRTVGIADVLYGITMQEKGVSKKVSVRVEDPAQGNN
jgi:chromosome segregation protein